MLFPYIRFGLLLVGWYLIQLVGWI